MKQALSVLLIWLTVPAIAGDISVKMPDGVDDDALISLYVADATNDAPVAQISAGKIVDLPDGPYVFGFDSFPWRSAAFDHSGNSTIELAGINVSAPSGPPLEFTLHDNADGALVRRFDSAGMMAVPQGAFHLRTDLSETRWDIQTEQGRVSEFALGGLTVETPLIADLAVHVAPADQDLIAGVLYAGRDTILLPAGRYRARSDQIPDTVAFAIAAGQTTPLPVRIVRGINFQDAPALELQVGTTNIGLGPGGYFQFAIVGEMPTGIVTDGSRRWELPDAHEIWLWQYPDGRMAHESGIKVASIDDAALVAIPGADFSFGFLLGFSGELAVKVSQGGHVLSDELMQFQAGWGTYTVLMPVDLDVDVPILVEVSMGPRDAPLRGRISDVPVHRFLELPVTGLAVDVASPTQIGLQWQASDEAGLTGYKVFRDGFDFAVSGTAPIQQTAFTDIGLSANRLYDYRICGVDEQGFLGSCAEIQAHTPRP